MSNAIAKHIVALRDANGRRVEIRAGEALPGWVPADVVGELVELGAVTLPTVEARAEDLRAQAEAVVPPGGSIDDILQAGIAERQPAGPVAAAAEGAGGDQAGAAEDGAAGDSAAPDTASAADTTAAPAEGSKQNAPTDGKKRTTKAKA